MLEITIFIALLGLYILGIIAKCWGDVSAEFKRESEDTALLDKKAEYETYKLPTKTEIKAISDITELTAIEKELEARSQEYGSLINEIEDHWRQEKSTLRLEKKMHRIDEMGRYVCDRREKLEQQILDESRE